MSGRVVAVDLGERRIGIAVSDATGVLATPAEAIHRCGDHRADHDRIASRALDLGAQELVIGLPVSMSGAVGPAARQVLGEVEELRAVLAASGIAVHVRDERLTTVSADRALRSGRAEPRAGAGSGRRGGARRASGSAAALRRRSGELDSAAAAVLLQAWLDGRRRTGEG